MSLRHRRIWASDVMSSIEERTALVSSVTQQVHVPLFRQREAAPEAIGRREAVLKAAGVVGTLSLAAAQPASAAPAIGYVASPVPTARTVCPVLGVSARITNRPATAHARTTIAHDAANRNATAHVPATRRPISSSRALLARTSLWAS